MYMELEKMIKKRICSKGNKRFVLYDMCCGIGVYSVLFHEYFDECIGIDYNPNNIKIAKEMKVINNINNIKFLEGKIEEIMEKTFKEDSREKILIFNPARSGLSTSALNFINKRKNESFIFILCESKSIGSLNKIFKDLNYCFKIEMFVETSHFEYILQVT